jgi:hypothetical protein
MEKKDRIVIQGTEFMVNGNRMVKINGIQAKGYIELPNEYIMGEPMCYFRDGILSVQDDDCTFAYLRIGQVYSEELYRELNCVVNVYPRLTRN